MDNNNYKKYQAKTDTEQDRRIGLVEKHIATINSEMGDIKQNVAKIKTDVSWLKKFFWVVTAASIGSVIASIFNLIVR